MIERDFGEAATHISNAIGALERLDKHYLQSNIAMYEIINARRAALKSKVDALKAVRSGLNPHAYPWSEDNFLDKE